MSVMAVERNLSSFPSMDDAVSVGFTGTREGMSYTQWETVYSILTSWKVEELHHGDCTGADAEVHAMAVQLEIPLVIHPPLNPRYRAWSSEASAEYRPPKKYHARDRDIVDETDVLLATPKSGDLTFGGTGYTIAYAKNNKTPVVIVLPDGSVNSWRPE